MSLLLYSRFNRGLFLRLQVDQELCKFRPAFEIVVLEPALMILAIYPFIKSYFMFTLGR
jgi:uncharacterized membrane protein